MFFLVLWIREGVNVCWLSMRNSSQPHQTALFTSRQRQHGLKFTTAIKDRYGVNSTAHKYVVLKGVTVVTERDSQLGVEMNDDITPYS